MPGKNLRSVAGKPLIAWTIETALQCPLLDRVIVTTDSPEIVAVAREFGAEVPFMRPAELAGDDVPGVDPLIHAVQWLEAEQQYRPDLVVLLQPTSPLRGVEEIEGSIRLIVDKSADSVISVAPAPTHPYWMRTVDDAGRMRDFIEHDRSISRRQDLPPVYAVDGTIYLIRREVLLRERALYVKNTVALIMTEHRSLDIDTEWDLRLADLALTDRLGSD